MNQPTFEQLPEMVSRILEKVEVLENLLLQNNQNKEEMLNIQEAAIFLELSVPTLYSKVCRREIPVYKPGKRLYFQKSELSDWIKSGQTTVLTPSRNLSSNELLTPKKLRHSRRRI